MESFSSCTFSLFCLCVGFFFSFRDFTLYFLLSILLFFSLDFFCPPFVTFVVVTNVSFIIHFSELFYVIFFNLLYLFPFYFLFFSFLVFVLFSSSLLFFFVFSPFFPSFFFP